MATKEPSLVYSYTKIRNTFGRQPMFCETRPILLDTIAPNISEQKEYCLRNPVNRETQTSVHISEHDVNTKRIFHRDQGMNHSEGGWPKEISCTDEEATSRYKRRIERDDNYVDSVLSLYPEFVHYIDQNNAIEMYNMYFKDMPPEQVVEKSSIRVKNVFKDMEKRPIGCLGWTYEDEPKLVAGYCDKKFPVCDTTEENITCFVWNVEIPHIPYAEFCGPSACWQVACSPVHPSVIVGGLRDGRVCIFDIRNGKEPSILSEMHLAHRDPVSSLLYIHSRLNNEFFSASTDGQCMWWDIRNISSPIDKLMICIRIPPGEQMNLTNSEGVSVLQYDKSFPTKFLCGTDTGYVINVNRKGKTYQEVLSAIFEAHNGPVKSVHRSPCTSKVFITCGDWSVNIWSDDVHTSPIISGIRHRHQITDVVWAPQRVSSYMSVGGDGKFRYWDLLRKFREPVLMLNVSKYPLLKMKPHDDGKMIAIGDAKGSLHLLSLSDNLVYSGNKDKQLMTQTLERETRREHILEIRIKEIRLKLKADETAERESLIDDDNYESVLRDTEEEYKRIVSEESRRTGLTPSSGAKNQMMRNR
ncbi:dynein intermediate chain 3, ciliary-like [Epargyreus clarus]|uniref:dynein intermediate chain 3, ciliary-like n=1 Tax=Epargyreus clarus TaxID=520877 RepID=UPI003C2E4E79